MTIQLIQPLSADSEATPSQSLCPSCGGLFPFRSNKRFCSPRCRDNAKKRKARRLCPVNAAHSFTKARQQEDKFELAMRMAERLYSIPPMERYGYLEGVIQLARNGHAPLVRDILTTPQLLRPDPSDKYLFYRRCPRSYCTIAQAADRYCRWSPWAAPVVFVVKGIAPEPPTGVIRKDGSIDDGGEWLRRKGFAVHAEESGDTLYKRETFAYPKVHPWYNQGHEYPNRMRRFTPTEELEKRGHPH